MYQKLLPHNIEAERAVVGAMLRGKDNAQIALNQLLPEDFYNIQHSQIFKIIADMHQNNEPIEPIKIADKLTISGIKNAHSYLTEIACLGAPSKDLLAHCAIIKEKAQLRELIKLCNYTAELAFKADNITEVYNQHRNSIEALKLNKGFGIASVNDILTDHYENLEERQTKIANRIKTGYEALDNLIAIDEDNLIVIGARTSMGKSAFAINLAYNMVRANNPIGFFSLETSKASVIDRLLAIESKIPLWKIRTGKLIDTDYDTIKEAVKNLNNYAMFYIDDTASIALPNLVSTATQMVSLGVKIIFVDYIGLIKTTKQDTREREVANITATLKALAKRLKIPVVALTQLNRQLEYRNDKRPSLSDIRESGSIEQDADAVILLYRKNYYSQIPSVTDDTEIIVAKNREGSTGFIELNFYKPCLRFIEAKTEGSSSE